MKEEEVKGTMGQPKGPHLPLAHKVGHTGLRQKPLLVTFLE